MCGAIGRKEHAQFPNGIDPTGTAQFADKRFCCQNVWVDEGLVGTSDERMAQVKSCPLAGQNDQMAFPLIFRRFSDPVGQVIQKVCRGLHLGSHFSNNLR